MRFSKRHIAGLIFAALLAIVLYWVWQDGLGLVQRRLRTVPMLRSIWAEFGLMTFLLLSCIFLGVAQWLWDKLPSVDSEH